MKPNSTWPPAGTVEFQPTWPTSTVLPFLEITAAFQIDEMAPGIESVAVQLF